MCRSFGILRQEANAVTSFKQYVLEDIGLIEVKDFFSYVAVRKSKVSHTLQQIKTEKIKNKRIKIDIAK